MIDIKRSVGRGFTGTPGSLYDILVQLQNMALLTPTEVYFVSKGGNNTTGKSWKTAFTTLTAAITAQRAMRADKPSAEQSVDTYIIMAPGLYEENIITFPFSTTIIGLGVLGTDKSTEIHPEVGSCMAGIVSGLRLYNISFQGGTGTADTIDFNICNNVHIVGCEFYPGATNSNAAISTQNCGMSVFKGNRILTQSAFKYTYGIYFGGGADKYCIANDIDGNIITGLAPTGTGIHVASNCTSTANGSPQTIFRKNIIAMGGAGIGIDDDSDQIMLIQNKIFTIGGAGFDANEDLAIDNIWNNGTNTVHYPAQTD